MSRAYLRCYGCRSIIRRRMQDDRPPCYCSWGCYQRHRRAVWRRFAAHNRSNALKAVGEAGDA